MDCDSDAIVALAKGGLRYLRNEGGNANSQVKVQLFGNRSNASGIGCKVEIETGGLRLSRTVQRLPVEVGRGETSEAGLVPGALVQLAARLRRTCPSIARSRSWPWN